MRRGVTAPHSEHWITWLQRRRVDFLRIAYPLVVEDAMPACFTLMREAVTIVASQSIQCLKPNRSLGLISNRP